MTTLILILEETVRKNLKRKKETDVKIKRVEQELWVITGIKTSLTKRNKIYKVITKEKDNQ